MGKLKNLFKKYLVMFRRKDKNALIENPLKDYGDFDIDIIYSTDYLQSIGEYKVPICIIFCIVIDSTKEDIIRDYYDKFIPFLSYNNINHIFNIKDNKLYTYVRLEREDIFDIIDYIYPDGKDISFILSNMMTVFFNEMNTVEIFDQDKYSEFKYRNEVDKIPHTEYFKIRSKTNSYTNILFMDRISNINEVFTPLQILSITKIFILKDTNAYKPIDPRELTSYTYITDTINMIFDVHNRNAGDYIYIIDLYKALENIIENDSYFNINVHNNSVNLLQYARTNKAMNKYIYSNESLYNDIDEVVDDESDYKYNPEFDDITKFDHSIYGSEDNKL